MEQPTIVHFRTKPDIPARKHRWAAWEYRTESCLVQLDGQVALDYREILLPGQYTRKKPWQRETFREYAEGIPDVPAEGRQVYYVLDEKARELFGREMEPAGGEWLQLLLDCFAGEFDALVLLENREMEADTLIRRYVSCTRYVAVVTNAPQNWTDMSEDINEEYGFLLEVASSVKKLHIKGKGRVLFVAGSELYGCTPAWLPEGSLWVDLYMGDTEGRRLCARARKTEYISMDRLVRLAARQSRQQAGRESERITRI